jgi:hypothetical protein
MTKSNPADFGIESLFQAQRRVWILQRACRCPTGPADPPRKADTVPPPAPSPFAIAHRARGQQRPKARAPAQFSLRGPPPPSLSPRAANPPGGDCASRPPKPPSAIARRARGRQRPKGHGTAQLSIRAPPPPSLSPRPAKHLARRGLLSLRAPIWRRCGLRSRRRGRSLSCRAMELGRENLRWRLYCRAVLP